MIVRARRRYSMKRIRQTLVLPVLVSAAVRCGPSVPGRRLRQMHQQIRVVLATPSSVQDGSGAMAVVPVEVDPREVEEGALVRLLKLLAGKGYDLRIAGGRG